MMLVQGFTFHRCYPEQSPAPPSIKLLSYADDTLLFLHDVADLQVVAAHLQNYSLASNAQINFHKTCAISLSGHDIAPHWLTAMQQFDITHIWSVADEEAIRYLGHPLIQSSRQRQAFASHFLWTLRQTVELQSRRGISVYGRATIANSLIMSKCWYVLSVLPLPLEFLWNIRTIIASFVTLHIHPVISWYLMVTSKSRGSLGVIDLFAQQKALIYRRLDPILFERSNVLSISKYVRLHLLNHMNTTIMDMRLLFPAARSSALVGASITTVTMIFRAMDAIPRTFLPADRNPIECLLLPIPAIIQSTTSPYKLAKKLKSVTAGDIFELQASGFFLSPIPSNRLPNHLTFVAHRFRQALTRVDCLLRPFFRACLERTALSLYSQDDRPHIQAMLNLSSFHKDLHIQPSDDNFAYSQGRTRSFRQMVLEATERRLPATQAIAASSWKAFWALFLDHTLRNVFYRLIHHKIPTRLYSSHCNSSDDPRCAICLTVVESMDHFFFYCEVKQHFWDRLIQECLWPDSPTAFDLLVIFNVALAEVWKAHCRFIFDAVPSTTDSLFTLFQRALTKMQAEDNLPPSAG
ncbi:hypothetical protein [Parasitella parasitica]|uniref:Reverse transcriptase zinc-binding domain-containing protein n=1 Tax=Parasitella parasitica TaxID=35722 RepID=A0A0B7N6B3_9FUNG|nr:hypothetical protein [Parasitella parasitica]